MAEHHRTRPADPTTPTTMNRDRSMVPVFTTEMYQAAFSTQGSHPMGGVALARTLEEARQHLADMLIFADPTAPATAEIIGLPPRLPRRGLRRHRRRHLPQSECGDTRPDRHRPGHYPPVPGSGERDVPDPDQRERDHRPPPQSPTGRPRLHPHLAPRLPADPR